MENSIITSRISRDSRKRVIKDYIEMHTPFSPFDNIEHYTNRSINKDAEALCLFSALLWIGIDKSSNVVCDYNARFRDENARRQLHAKSQYRTLTDEQFNDVVAGKIKEEIKNSFAHGNFEVGDSTSGERFFVLSPKRSPYKSEYKIYVPFQNVCALVLNYINEQIKHVDQEKYFQNIDVPTTLLNLFTYYSSNGNTNQEKIDDHKFKSNLKALEIALLCADFTWNEDTYYDDYGKNSEIFKMISLLRNSMRHETFSISSNAKTISINNANINTPYTHTEDVNSFLFKILAADMAADFMDFGKAEENENVIELAKNVVSEGWLEKEGNMQDILTQILKNVGLFDAEDNNEHPQK